MMIFVPAGINEIEEKEKWFDREICQELKKKGVGMFLYMAALLTWDIFNDMINHK